MPKIELVRDTFDGAAAAIRATYFRYDGSSDYLAAPTKGDLTQVQRRASLSPSVSTTETFAYDQWGNRTDAYDGLNNRTRWSYDATHHLHVVSETNAPGHVTALTPNVLCGNPASSSDPNAVAIDYTYDAFCRLRTRQNGKTGSLTRIGYVAEGDPAGQYMLVERSLPNRVDLTGTQYFYDGAGRIYRKRDHGDTAALPSRLTDTAFDRRGNAFRVSHPAFEGEAAYSATTTLDWADRPLVATNPDGTARTTTYGLQAALLSFTANVPFASSRNHSILGQIQLVEDYAETMEMPSLLCDAFFVRAKLLRDQGETTLAGTVLSRALALAKRNGMNLRMNSALTSYAQVLALRGLRNQANRLLFTCLEIAKRNNNQLEIARAEMAFDELHQTRQSQSPDSI